VNLAIAKIKQYLVLYGDFRSLAEDLGYAQMIGLDSSNKKKETNPYCNLKNLKISFLSMIPRASL
jgi:hypothetical protein